METVKDILWPIVVIGSLGAFIDFLIGKTGQERAKDFLLRWWVRFDDVRWRTFGTEEGLFAGNLIEKWFGRRIWSPRRVIAAFGFFIVFMILGYSKYLISPDSTDCFDCMEVPIIGGIFATAEFAISKINDSTIICVYCTYNKIWYFGLLLLVAMASFSISFSFTRWITFRMAKLCSVGEARNIFVFTLMLFTNYLILVFWFPITIEIKNILMLYISTMFDNANFSLSTLEFIGLKFVTITLGHHLHKTLYQLSLLNVKYLLTMQIPIDLFACSLLSLFPSLFRFILSMLFVGSFLLKPLIMRPINLVWARIIESEKPVFTVIFGGAAAFATAMSEAAKHLPG